MALTLQPSLLAGEPPPDMSWLTDGKPSADAHGAENDYALQSGKPVPPLDTSAACASGVSEPDSEADNDSDEVPVDDSDYDSDDDEWHRAQITLDDDDDEIGAEGNDAAADSDDVPVPERQLWRELCEPDVEISAGTSEAADSSAKGPSETVSVVEHCLAVSGRERVRIAALVKSSGGLDADLGIEARPLASLPMRSLLILLCNRNATLLGGRQRFRIAALVKVCLWPASGPPHRGALMWCCWLQAREHAERRHDAAHVPTRRQQLQAPVAAVSCANTRSAPCRSLT
jgi:hypothetical protein